MLFNLQKVLAFLVMPLGLVWLLLLGLTLWSRRLRRPAFTVCLGLLWILLTAAGNPWVGQRLMARLEGKIASAEQDPNLDLEAVFVLGGGSDLNAQGQPQFGSHGDRVAKAANLWHAGRTRFLVASGRSNDSLPGERDLGQETRLLWLGLGVPDSAIRVVETPCYTTREEIQAYREICRQQGWDRIGLLTSASHLPRALAQARKVGLTATPLASDFRGRPRRFRPQDLVPQLEGIRLTHLAVWERIGQVMGR
jgi:uncharacterized SAM-binding protein YcdF (DUF218 family)